jgi:cellulose synthase/poly-beta-1,6-N-acetylglucosamine synthase-like glycosyltransferase/peptidoglycan/xylan/chitin deacetylase (PgdA/CDA1 family)
MCPPKKRTEAIPTRSPTAKANSAARRIGRRIERPPAHWSVLALVVFVLLFLLFAEGLSTHLTGQSGTPTPSGAGQGLSSEDTLLGARGGRLVPRSFRPGRRVALTFDDGPNPTWTPRIAAILSRLGVPATFFEVGDRVANYPGIAKSLADEGFEIGNHTFNHVDLTGLSEWQRELQISLTESAIAGAAGLRPRLVRPPYSSTPVAVTKADARAYLALAENGYLIALANYDGKDWQEPGVMKIVRNATPPGRTGGVILLHDGGGDRSQTVAALKRLVPRLRRRGFRFVSYSALAGIPRGQVDLVASSAQHLRGELLIDSLAMARWVTTLLLVLLVPIAALAVLRALVLVVFARRHAGAYRREPVGTFAPAVSIVVPAYNEAEVIEPAVRSLVGSDYPELEVIVVDDGSEDGTAAIVEGLALSGVRILREPNSGKPAALNAGIAAARHDVIVTVDADTVFEPGTLRKLVAPFAEERVGAVAGNTKVGNRKGMLGRWQHIDYVMGFNLDRRLYDVLECMPTVPGAIGAFRHAALREVGFFSAATLAEDTDVTIALGRAGWRVVYVEDARAFTEAPTTLSALWRQRYRWSYGTMQAIWKHRRALLGKDRGRRIGTVGIPYLLLFQVMLPLLAPLIDVFTIYGIVFLNPLPVLAYWLAFNALAVGLAIYAFRLDDESLRPLWAMPLQQLVYRQLMYLVVIQSVISALRGLRLRWQHVERAGEVELAG